MRGVGVLARFLRGERAAPGSIGSSELPIVAAEAPAESGALPNVSPQWPSWGVDPARIPIRHELLPGRSSVEILSRFRVLGRRAVAVYAAIFVPVLIVGGFVWNQPAVVLGYVLLAPVAVFAGLGIAGDQGSARMREERAAGYTLWRTRFLTRPQVDPETGFEIRSPNAPALTASQERAALASVRELARIIDTR